MVGPPFCSHGYAPHGYATNRCLPVNLRPTGGSPWLHGGYKRGALLCSHKLREVTLRGLECKPVHALISKRCYGMHRLVTCSRPAVNPLVAGSNPARRAKQKQSDKRETADAEKSKNTGLATSMATICTVGEATLTPEPPAPAPHPLPR